MLGRWFALFDTPVGPCGIAWGTRGIIGVQLPEKPPAALRSRLRPRYPDATEAPAPGEISVAIEKLLALLRGERVDLGHLDLDLADVAPFDVAVYAVARVIPPGATVTYGEIAAKVGRPGAAREVGQALGRNPFPLIVPCHRVVAAGGKLGGFSARGGAAMKRRLLAIEHARAGRGPDLFDHAAPTG